MTGVGEVDTAALESQLQSVFTYFNIKVGEDQSLADHLEGKERRVRMDLGGGLIYSFELRERALGGLKRSDVDSPDVIIFTDPATLSGLITKDIKPIKAYATGKLKIKASISDLLTLKKLFEG